MDKGCFKAHIHWIVSLLSLTCCIIRNSEYICSVEWWWIRKWKSMKWIYRSATECKQVQKQNNKFKWTSYSLKSPFNLRTNNSDPDGNRSSQIPNRWNFIHSIQLLWIHWPRTMSWANIIPGSLFAAIRISRSNEANEIIIGMMMAMKRLCILFSLHCFPPEAQRKRHKNIFKRLIPIPSHSIHTYICDYALYVKSSADGVNPIYTISRWKGKWNDHKSRIHSFVPPFAPSYTNIASFSHIWF